jgi:hypothetical protein
MPILDAIRKFIHSLDSDLVPRPIRRATSTAREVGHYLEELFELFPFTPQARAWLRENIRVQIVDMQNLSGGGGWHADQSLVRLNGIQYEAAIHELAHALWHRQRRNKQVRDEFVAAVHRLSADNDPRWERVHTLACHYVHGIADQPGFEHGLLLPRHEWGSGAGPQGQWNDWEMYAGLASGCMADIRLLPPYVRRFYADHFRELDDQAPSPDSRTVHP